MFRFIVIALFCISICNGSLIENKDELNCTRNFVKKSSHQLLSGNFSYILPSIDVFESCLTEIIQETYGNDIQNVNAVLDFIDECPKSYKIIFYEAIFKDMEKNDHLWTSEGFHLAFAISSLDPNWKLAKGFPETIYKLYFQVGNCLLKSVAFNEYYYAAVNFFAFDKYRRRNFCYTKGTTSKKMVYDIRKIRNDVFTLRSVNFNEYLYAEEAYYAHSTQRRRVFTFRPRTMPHGSEWKIEPQPNAQKIVKLRNLRYDELLFADPNIRHNKERREVFTERIKGVANEKWTLWSLEC